MTLYMLDQILGIAFVGLSFIAYLGIAILIGLDKQD